MFVITGWTAKQKRGRDVLKSIGSEPTQQQVLGDNYEKIVNALKDNDQVSPRAPKPKPRPGPRTAITPARSGKSNISDLMATARTTRDKSVVQPSAGMAVELVSSSRVLMPKVLLTLDISAHSSRTTTRGDLCSTCTSKAEERRD
jgi:hypothetical protein